MNCKILLFFFLTCTICIAQNPVYPVRDATVNLKSLSSDVMWFGYTPIKKNGNSYEMYYTTHGTLKYATSQAGTNWTFVDTVNAPSNEAIIKKGNVWYMGYHRTYQDTVSFYTSQSTDGMNFTPGVRRFQSGEDMSFIINNDSFYCYIRPTATDPNRKIGLMKSANFTNWTPITTIMSIDSADYVNPNSPDFRKQLYNMCAFKVGQDWYGLVNVLRVGDQGQDLEQPPPYNTLEHTVETQLVYSSDGINWKRTNNRQAFIQRAPGMMEVFGLPTVVNNTLYIYTIESQRRHTDYESSHVNGRYFEMWRYSISLDDLATWKPATNLNLTMAIEGLMTSSGGHSIKDSATIQLRRNYYPYAVVDSAFSQIDSVSLAGQFALRNVTSGSYYIVVKGKNFIETWSSNPVPIIKGQTLNLNFTASQSLAYGNNLILKHGKYCLHSGDIDNNGMIELVDVLTTFNDADDFSSGYMLTDLNGDQVVDLADLTIVNNNANKFITRKRP